MSIFGFRLFFFNILLLGVLRSLLEVDVYGVSGVIQLNIEVFLLVRSYWHRCIEKSACSQLIL
jgi:hypothetical protein